MLQPHPIEIHKYLVSINFPNVNEELENQMTSRDPELLIKKSIEKYRDIIIN